MGTFITLQIITPDHKVVPVDVKKDGDDVFNVDVIFTIDDGTALVAAEASKGMVFFNLDLNTLQITEAGPEDYKWLDCRDIFIAHRGSDGASYVSTTNGVTRIDFKNKTMEECFNYGQSAVNRGDVKLGEAVDVNDGTVIIYTQPLSFKAFEQSQKQSAVLVFKKAAQNPHAGKSILELFNADTQMDDMVSDAIFRFNESSSEYYIEVTDRYDKFFATDGMMVFDSFDAKEEKLYEMKKALSDELTTDIMNGDGPDILINTSSFGQLNNPNYLADLSKSTGDLSSDKYFTNIIEGAKVNGTLYQMPVTFAIKGIQTDSKNAGSSGAGFTTAEYEQFLSGTLNGKDVITYGQTVYFSTLFNAMSDTFIKNGKADLGTPEFRELAEFVKNNVSETGKDWNESFDDDFQIDGDAFTGNFVPDEAQFVTHYGIYNFFYAASSMNGCTDILGLPSTDGRGPMASANLSVAISSQAYNFDACNDFLKLLLSDDVQMNLAMADSGFTINRNAFRTACSEAVKYYNTAAGQVSLAWEISGETPGKEGTKFAEDTVDTLEGIILSCSKMSSPDSEINIILVEEMPAYFTGQKDLDQVIKITQDRIQKVLDERG